MRHILVASTVLVSACASSPDSRHGSSREPSADICAATRARTRAIVADLVEANEGAPDVDAILSELQPFGDCVEPTADGFWVLPLAPDDIELTTETYDDYSGDIAPDAEVPTMSLYAVMVGAVRPVFVTRDGRMLVAEEPSGEPTVSIMLNGAGEQDWPPFPFKPMQAGAELVFDWNSDGISELAIGSSDVISIYRTDGRTSVALGLTHGLPNITEIRDIDGDGRPDLVDNGLFEFTPNYVSENIQPMGVVARSLSDGTFTRDDSATRAHYARICKDMGRSPWALGRTPEKAFENMACARMFGVSGDVIREALNLEVGKVDDDAEPDELTMLFGDQAEDVAAWLKIEPPASVGRDDGLVTHVPVRVTAISSEKDFRHYRFDAMRAADGDRGSAWQPLKASKNPWIEMVFAEPVVISQLEIANGFQRTDALGDLFAMNQRPTRITITAGGRDYPMTLDASDRGVQRFVFPEPVSTAMIRLAVNAAANGTKWQHIAISEIRALGPVR